MLFTTLIVVTSIVVLMCLLELKKSRPDGTFIDRVHPYRTMLMHVMPTRNESVVYFDTYARADKLLEYIEQVNKRFSVDMTHCVVGAVMIGAVENPKMNQFVMGRRLYRRNGTWVTFSMKRQKMNREAKLSAVKMQHDPQETFEQLCARINGHIKVERSGEVTAADKEFNILTIMPRPLLRLGVKLFRVLDYYNLLPGGFIKLDPMYTTVFVANLGSVGMAAGYHHLYEWGNAPLFAMIGKVEERALVRDGQVVIEKVLPIRYSYDERIDDGLTSNYGILAVNRVLENPAHYFGCLDPSGADTHPMKIEQPSK